MRIGFVGLGVMGTPMALNLIEAGHELVVHRVKERSRVLIESGAYAAGSPRELAQHAEVVICMLPDTPDVQEVLFGRDGALEGLEPGSLVIDMSSISPSSTVEFARRITESGSAYVDAPVSGGEVGAQQGALTVFVGGDDSAVERAMPLLRVMGATISVMGAVGAGQATKVVNQVIVGLTIQAVAEGLALAEASSVDPAKVRAALGGGFASSRILELHGERMLDRRFDPGFRMRLHRKDIALALEAARQQHAYLPGTQAVAIQMDEALANDWGELDHAALFRVLTEDDQ